VGSTYFESQIIATCSKSHESLAKEMKDVIAVYKVIHVTDINIMQQIHEPPTSNSTATAIDIPKLLIVCSATQPHEPNSSLRTR
jgi:hypothetical protein